MSKKKALFRLFMALLIATSAISLPTHPPIRANDRQGIRVGHTMTLLQNGKVLIVGVTALAAYTQEHYSGSDAMARADLYDPVTQTWTVVAPMNTARFGHTATLLPDGQVLIAGGTADMENGYISTERYDPVTNIWTIMAPMSIARFGHAAVLLQNGKLLIVGGEKMSDDTQHSVYAELYDPKNNQWSRTGPTYAEQPALTATLLADGEVLVTGGAQMTPGKPYLGVWGRSMPAPSRNAALYAPATNTWRDAAPMNSERAGHSSTLLPNGKILVAGGSMESKDIPELYTLATNTWTQISVSAPCTGQNTATLLPGGIILFIGTDVLTRPSETAFLLDTEDYTWRKTTPLQTPRFWHRAVLLSSGKVLIVGGISSGESNCCASFLPELYDPAANTWAAG